MHIKLRELPPTIINCNGYFASITLKNTKILLSRSCLPSKLQLLPLQSGM